jgi:hypothetical protein
MKTMKSFFARIVIGLFVICLIQGAGFAQKVKVNVSKLTAETQKSDDAPDRFTLVWWIPEEFWKYTFEQDSSITKELSEQIMEYFRPYTMVLVADGVIGSFGGIEYTSEQVLRKNIRIIDNSGKSYYSVDEDDINADTKNFLALMEPILVNMLGPMGKNMNFYVFPAKTSSGQKIADPYSTGTFSVKFDERDFKWRLPLGSLIPTKKCPVDGEEMNGAWKYCPWHGTQLK